MGLHFCISSGVVPPSELAPLHLEQLNIKTQERRSSLAYLSATKAVCCVIISCVKRGLIRTITVCPCLCTPGAVLEHNRLPSHTVSRSQIQFLPEAQDDPQRRRPDIRKAKMMLSWEPVVCVIIDRLRQAARLSLKCSQAVLQTHHRCYRSYLSRNTNIKILKTFSWYQCWKSHSKKLNSMDFLTFLSKVI